MKASFSESPGSHSGLPPSSRMLALFFEAPENPQLRTLLRYAALEVQKLSPLSESESHETESSMKDRTPPIPEVPLLDQIQPAGANFTSSMAIKLPCSDPTRDGSSAGFLSKIGRPHRVEAASDLESRWQPARYYDRVIPSGSPAWQQRIVSPEHERSAQQCFPQCASLDPRATTPRLVAFPRKASSGAAPSSMGGSQTSQRELRRMAEGQRNCTMARPFCKETSPDTCYRMRRGSCIQIP